MILKTDEVIDIKVICANNFFKRFKGLMGKKDIDYVLLFTNLTDLLSVRSHLKQF